MLREELDELGKLSNGRLKVYVSLMVSALAVLIADATLILQHVLNNPPASWTQGIGFISRAQIEDYMPSSGVGSPIGGSKVLMCGPPPMIAAMKGHLAAIGYPAPKTISKLEDQVFCF